MYYPAVPFGLILAKSRMTITVHLPGLANR
jgi:hypothetical protein